VSDPKHTFLEVEVGKEYPLVRWIFAAALGGTILALLMAHA
jgi:hypothetical protein